MPAFFLRGFHVTPTQIFQDCTGKQHIVLQHHRHLVSEGFHVIILHIHAAYQKLALRHIIESADQVHQAGLGASGTADNTDGLTRFDFQVDILQNRVRRIFLIAEGHMVELDAAVLYLVRRFLRIRKVRFFLQHFTDTSGACHGHGDHDKDHGQHHQAHQNIHTIGQHVHQLPRGQGILNNHMCSHPADCQDTGVYGKVHHRVVPEDDTLRLTEYFIYVVAGLLEFLYLVFLTDIGLYHPDCGYVFLHTFVQCIVFRKRL